MILQHLDKNNLHHAYLIEGIKEDILPEIFDFFKDIGFESSNNPNFYNISVDLFKINDSFNLKSLAQEKGFSSGVSKEAKKIFLVSANNFLLEAQNTLLKILEEPIDNTHFFFIVPDVNILLKTFTSRFFILKNKSLNKETKEVEKFLSMDKKGRIDFIKNMLIEEDEDITSNARFKVLVFLNTLEFVLYKKIDFKKNHIFFDQIFKVREFVSQPGSSMKNLLESIALIIPTV